MCEERNGPPLKTTTRTLYDRSESIICQWLQLQKEMNEPLNRVQLSLLMPPLFHLPFCRMQIYIVTVQTDGYYTRLFVVVNDLGFQTTSCLGYTVYIFFFSTKWNLPTFFAVSLQDQLKSHQAINSKIHIASQKLRWDLGDFLWDLVRYRDTHCSEGIDHMGWFKKSLYNLNIHIYRHIYICGIQVNTMNLTHWY